MQAGPAPWQMAAAIVIIIFVFIFAWYMQRYKPFG